MELDRDKDFEIPKRAPEKERSPQEGERPYPFIPSRLGHLAHSTGFHSGPIRRRKGWRLATWSFLASTIDVLILISLTGLFLLCSSLLLNLNLNHQLTLFFGTLFVATTWSYLIVFRCFFGMTVGEWACDLRLGQPHERLRHQYLLKVLLRSTLVLLTGFLLLPLLSLLLGTDVAGKWSGLTLFSLK